MLLPSSLPALLLAVPLVLLVTGESESVLTNENLTNAVTTEQYHDNITMPPQVPTLNVTLLSETSHSLPHNAHSNTTLQINETLLFDNTTEANITYEDNESFQDQEKNHPGWHCNAEQLELYSHMYCGSYFHNHMVSVPEQTWCDWEDIKIHYNEVSECMEKVANALQCYYPNQHTQEFFVGIHQTYFHACPEEEEVPWDAPPGLVLALTLLPVSLIPVLVFMVVWKNNARE
ncbi:receptor activity-modifying protein 2-like isoform X2 [Sardina pilchardus]|uniref:receptor activity-modifying protein 2-like isoform X2 n=1 Tax=Sardina pilchardus TaxID=27697 RepID=UPI002E13FD82